VIAALDFMRSQACTAFLPGASREPVAGVRDQKKIFQKNFLPEGIPGSRMNRGITKSIHSERGLWNET
jgi:hypothetical protein